MTDTSVLSNWGGNQALQLLLGNATWLALHQEDPTVAGLISTEVPGADRQLITFASPSGKTAVQNLATLHSGLPACTVTHLAGWTSFGAGSMIWSKQLPGSGLVVPEGGQFLTAVGDIAISL